MKVTVGMRVTGEVDGGTVVAMSAEWCIYRTDKKGRDGSWECAEPWTSIIIEAEPGEVASSIPEKELP
jgi:hypothetical protein